ncbi:hypothetical protein AVEN_166972-1 [Araneus ventricosus]|uniref:Uncharacterized protein n=1 Tax=Araneus ventricosus TaxID=182803 RepID=A0A4Y2GXU6_ARAVE|nr:hypothetical protein AVEN_166972-1 [Araneus ventricosus]
MFVLSAFGEDEDLNRGAVKLSSTVAGQLVPLLSGVPGRQPDIFHGSPSVRTRMSGESFLSSQTSDSRGEINGLRRRFAGIQ